MFGGVFLEEYLIKGGKKLDGAVKISGAKNAALPILAAAVMTRGENVFTACPQISDVSSMLKILQSLGCKVDGSKETVSVDASMMNRCRIPDRLMKEMRSSVFLAGALLTRCGEAVISSPGGCDIGKRPIDIHISGLEKLGAKIEQKDGCILIKGNKLEAADVIMPYPSVGATENIMMAAIGAKGTTRLINCAREPEIADLQNYINRCGGKISGAGTGVITVEGGRELKGCEHRIMADRIEAGTYLLMALATEGRVFLDGISRPLIEPLMRILENAGYDIKSSQEWIWASYTGGRNIHGIIRTAPYPGFPTDLQPQITTFLAKAGAGAIIEENIFEKRFEYVKQLKKMGADIEIFENKVIIRNNNILCGAQVEAQDLRGGAALVIAGLMADGSTVVRNTKYIKRGYGEFTEKIKGLGGEITVNEN